MTDTEALNLIEHYKWTVSFFRDKVVVITEGGITVHNTLRDAVSGAISLQAEWALGTKK